MIHIRVDDQPLNSARKFACGIGPELPKGDVYYYSGEYSAARADCPGCNPRGPQGAGWSASEMDGNASNRANNPDGWNRWVAFCEANGHP